MKLNKLFAICLLFLQVPAMAAADAAEDRQHFQRPDEEDVPEIDITAHPTEAPSEVPTAFPTRSPSDAPSGM